MANPYENGSSLDILNTRGSSMIGPRAPGPEWGGPQADLDLMINKQMAEIEKTQDSLKRIGMVLLGMGATTLSSVTATMFVTAALVALTMDKAHEVVDQAEKQDMISKEVANLIHGIVDMIEGVVAGKGRTGSAKTFGKVFDKIDEAKKISDPNSNERKMIDALEKRVDEMRREFREKVKNNSNPSKDRVRGKSDEKGGHSEKREVKDHGIRERERHHRLGDN